MRPEGSSLDLNYLPRDSIRDDHHTVSVSGRRRARRRGDYEDNENNDGNNSKLYECRFCSQKFCKSQALGGHMNRHRHEREAETLDKARQLVYGTDPNLGVGSYVGAGTMYPHNMNPSDYQVYNMGGGAPTYPSDHQQVYYYHDHDHHTSATTVPYLVSEGFMSSRGHGGSSSTSSSTSTTTASHLYCDPSTCTNGASIGLDGPPMNRWAPHHIHIETPSRRLIFIC